MKNKKTFKEGYDIKFNYQKPDGYWNYGVVEEVFVNVKHGINEKANHEEAKKILLQKYPNAQIVRVDYQ